MAMCIFPWLETLYSTLFSVLLGLEGYVERVLAAILATHKETPQNSFGYFYEHKHKRKKKLSTAWRLKSTEQGLEFPRIHDISPTQRWILIIFPHQNSHFGAGHPPMSQCRTNMAVPGEAIGRCRFHGSSWELHTHEMEVLYGKIMDLYGQHMVYKGI